MAAEIIFIKEGYARKKNDGWDVNSAICLIKSDGKYVLCDPGCNRTLLEQSLKDNSINYDDIDIVFLSHNHIDHILLSGLFAKAEIYSYENYIYKNDKLRELKHSYITNDIKRIYTPGHCLEHYSLIINTDIARFCFAADVFWFEDNEEAIIDVFKEDPFVESADMLQKLIASRQYLINNSDVIIPGHGKIIKNY